ncbi:hypothetical protein ACPW96_17415 [Micromonospora sp. DT81.3]|uniref:hypothetical protein n=1 Tax=Micromonospora sp. DT81.3 TaxID=3416523 RepID=UPI003CEE346C
MTGDVAEPPPEWDGEATVPAARDATVPSAREATVPSAREATVPSARVASTAEPTDDDTVVVRRGAASAERTTPVDEDARDPSARAASSPDADRLRTPYAPRTAPVLASRSPRPSPPTGQAVDREAVARGIRRKARRQAAAFATAGAAILITAGTLLVVMVSSGG